MTDNEIIKALECCSQNGDFTKTQIEICSPCSYVNCGDCTGLLKADALDLIKRQQAEIERFKNRQKPTGASGYKVENGKVVFFTNMLGGCKVVKENLEEVVKTMNELLQECYSKDEIAFALKCKTQELKTAKAEAVKEFAERLKEKAMKNDFICMGEVRATEYIISKHELDNLVKETVGDG